MEAAERGLLEEGFDLPPESVSGRHDEAFLAGAEACIL